MKNETFLFACMLAFMVGVALVLASTYESDCAYWETVFHVGARKAAILFH